MQQGRGKSTDGVQDSLSLKFFMDLDKLCSQLQPCLLKYKMGKRKSTGPNREAAEYSGQEHGFTRHWPCDLGVAPAPLCVLSAR